MGLLCNIPENKKEVLRNGNVYKSFAPTLVLKTGEMREEGTEEKWTWKESERREVIFKMGKQKWYEVAEVTETGGGRGVGEDAF